MKEDMVKNRLLAAGLYAVVLLLLLLIVYLSWSGLLDVHRAVAHLLKIPTVKDDRQLTPVQRHHGVRILYARSENLTKYVDKRRDIMVSENKTNPYFIPRYTRVNPYNYSFLIDGREICQGDAPFLLVVVPSVYNHHNERKTVRETWGSCVKTGQWADGTKLPVIRLVFLFGFRDNANVFTMLKNESLQYGDVVLADFVDSYRNLTIKSMTALYWATQFCPDAKYLLKNDEDTIVHLPIIVEVLKKNFTNTIIGRFRRSLMPVNRGEGRRKWVVPVTEYPLRKYPDYIRGNYYVLPRDLIPKLFYLSEYIPYLRIEDVFITGIVRLAAGATMKNLSYRTCLLWCNFRKPKIAFVVGLQKIKKAWQEFAVPNKIPILS